jgi:hypothetical protein
MKFKVGDIVEILDKTTGYYLYQMSPICKKGDIDVICMYGGMNNEFLILSKHLGYHFRPIDLEIADYQEMLTKRYRKHVIYKKIK